MNERFSRGLRAKDAGRRDQAREQAASTAAVGVLHIEGDMASARKHRKQTPVLIQKGLQHSAFHCCWPWAHKQT